MTHDERFPRRHPLCICPELTLTQLIGLDSSAPAIDLDACRAQSGGITHPQIGLEEAHEMIAALTRVPGQGAP